MLATGAAISDDIRPRIRVIAATLAAGLTAGAVAALLALMPMNDPDLFWHLAVGRYIWAHHRLPSTNLWSFTAPDHPFLASSWLFDLALERLHALGGLLAVHLATAAAVGVAFAVLVLAVRARGASLPWALGTAVTLALGSESRFTPRPQVASYVLLALLSLLLVRDRAGARRRWLLGVPALLALWANLHAGVVFGLALVGFHLVGELLRGWPGLGAAGQRGLLLRCVAAGSVCLLAAFLNPGGPDLIRYALFHVSEVGSVVRLGEFESPTLHDRPVFWAVLVGTPLLLLAARKETRVPEWLGWLAFGVLACRAMRLIPEFFLVVGPSLGWAAERGFRRLAVGRVRPVIAGLFPVLLPLGALAVLPVPPAHLLRRIHLGLDPYRNAVRPVAQARQWGLSGRVFAGWDATGLVEWALPEAQVQVDPRLLAYPPEVFHALEQAEDSQGAFDAYVDRWEIGWAVRTQQRLRFTGAGLFSPQRWAVVFWDEGGQLLVRRDVPRFAELVRTEEFQEFLPATPVLESWRTLRGPRRARWLDEARRLGSTSPLLVDAHAALCLESARTGDLASASRECTIAAEAADERYWTHPTPGGLRSQNAAIAHLILATEITRHAATQPVDPLLTRAVELAPRSADVWAGKGTVLLDRGDGAGAVNAFQRALELDPSHRAASEGLLRAQTLVRGGSR